MSETGWIDDVLWLVPARSGSKGIKHKNIRALGGVPLLATRVRSALKLSPASNVWVSTDSAEYAAIATLAGATVPFLRPYALATDDASSMAVVRHAMDHADLIGAKFWALGLLQPSSPFVPSELLLGAVDELRANREASALVTVRRVNPPTFLVQPRDRTLAVLGQRFADKSRLRRQDLPEEITPSGGLFLSTWSNLRGRGTFYTDQTLSFEVSDVCGVDIDEPIDWQWAEFLLESGAATLE